MFGTFRRVSNPNFWRLQSLDILDKITLIPADLTDMSSLLEAVTISNPTEIYNLAAQSFVEASFDQPLLTSQVDGTSTTCFLEIIRHLKKDIRFYQASTSELYGSAVESPQSEKTRFLPNSPYAAAKLYSFHISRIYRHSYDAFATNGILFNHESPLRGLEFVTRKISNAVARIKLGLQKELVLGNIEAKRDWGYAPEYVEAMWRILQHDEPKDFVIATGETHSVKDFVKSAFSEANLNWEDFVKCDKRLFRPMEVNLLQGDYSKAKQLLNWEPKVKFNKLVSIMVKADIERWSKYLKGEIFPWDAPNFAGEMNLLKRT